MDKYLLEISSVPSVERERTGGVELVRATISSCLRQSLYVDTCEST